MRRKEAATLCDAGHVYWIPYRAFGKPLTAAELEKLREAHAQQAEALSGQLRQAEEKWRGLESEVSKLTVQLTEREQILTTVQSEARSLGETLRRREEEGAKLMAVLEGREAEVAKLSGTLEQREASLREQEAALAALRQREQALLGEVKLMEELRGRCEKAERQVAECSAESSRLQGVVQAKEGEMERLAAALKGEEAARREAEATGAKLTQRVQTLEGEEKRLLPNGSLPTRC